MRIAGLRGAEAAARATLRVAVNSHASANPAAETISDEGRSRRRSVKNRSPFDCFKSAEGIRFSVVARPTPKSFHRGGFWRNLLTPKGCIKKENAVRRTARAAAFAPRRPATRSTLVRGLRRPRPERPPTSFHILQLARLVLSPAVGEPQAAARKTSPPYAKKERRDGDVRKRS